MDRTDRRARALAALALVAAIAAPGALLTVGEPGAAAADASTAVPLRWFAS